MTRFEIVRKAMLADAGPVTKSVTALAMLGLATALGLAFKGVSGAVPVVPFAPYYPAVLLTALFLDWRWAAGSTVASVAIVGKLFLAPALGDWLTSPIWMRMMLFVLACLVLMAVGDTLRRVIRQMELLSMERDLLAHEMKHRVQNTLTIVDAMVTLGNKDVGTEQFSRDLSQRIKALARTNQLVLNGKVGGDCEVRQLVAGATSPFAIGAAFTCLGPEAWLPADASHYLMLILHELSTNALKHGALSVPEGTVQIRWSSANGAFGLEWREHGGPRVREPGKHGLGMRLLKSQTVFDARIDFQPGGLVCNLRLDGMLSAPEGVTAISIQESQLVSGPR